MKHETVHAAPTIVWITCDDCGGSGEATTFARWSGEGNGGEPVTNGYCENCHGEGGWEEEL